MEKGNGLASSIRLDRASGRTLPDHDFPSGDFFRPRLPGDLFSPLGKTSELKTQEKATTLGLAPPTPQGEPFSIKQPGIVSLSILQPTSPCRPRSTRWCRTKPIGRVRSQCPAPEGSVRRCPSIGH